MGPLWGAFCQITLTYCLALLCILPAFNSFSEALMWCVWADGYTRLTGGCFWERADELQWRPGSDNTAADNVTRPASCRHVCADVSQQSSTVPRHLQREGQSYGASVVGSAQTGTLHQAQTYSDCTGSCTSYLHVAVRSIDIAMHVWISVVCNTKVLCPQNLFSRKS